MIAAASPPRSALYETFPAPMDAPPARVATRPRLFFLRRSLWIMHRFAASCVIASTSVLVGCAASGSVHNGVADRVDPLELADDVRNERIRDLAGDIATGTAELSLVEYSIGASDLLEIRVFDAPEMSGPARVSVNGEVRMPLAGAVQAEGLTPEELGVAIEDALRGRYMVAPQVTVQVIEAQSRPVSVLGPVRQPGLVQIRGSRPLLEVLAMAGGLTPDAGETVLITRGEGASRNTVTVTLDVLLDSETRNQAVFVNPGDLVTVQRAGVIYVVGEVTKPGAFPLAGGRNITALQAIALGGGMTRTASRDRVTVVRTDAAGERTMIPLSMRAIRTGRDRDLKLLPDDVVYVQNSTARTVTLGTVDTMVRLVTFRPF